VVVVVVVVVAVVSDGIEIDSVIRGGREVAAEVAVVGGKDGWNGVDGGGSDERGGKGVKGVVDVRVARYDDHE